MQGLAAQPLLSVSGTHWSFGDAVLAGLLTGEWTRFEGRVATGLSLEAEGHVADADDLRAWLLDFRRGRRLTAAEDMRRWMQARGLDAAALEACARRAVLCDRAGEAGGDEALRRAPPPAGAVAACLRAEAFVHGAFARCGEALAARATAEAREPRQPVDPEAVAELVARAATGPDRGFSGDLPERCSAVLRAHAAHEHFRARTATPARLVERLRDRRLDLTRVRFDEIRLPSSAAAREAVLCLRVDGMVLPQVAVRAGVECAVQETEIEQLAGAMRTAIAAGRPGETIGPIPEDGDGGWRLAVLHERCAPTLDDARVRRRLIEEVAGLALARAAAGKVDWHGHV